MPRDVGVAPTPVAAPRGVEAFQIIPAANVTPHIEGERFWTDRDGPHAIQVAQVVGLTGNPTVRLYRATLAPGIPRYGDYHSAVPFLPVTLVEAVYADKGTSDIAIITITYGFSSGGTHYFMNEPGETTATLPQLEVLTTVQPAQTQFEIGPADDKRQIVVAHLEPPPEGEAGPPARIEQSGTVDYMLPMETVRYMRRELRDPQDKAREYVGTINTIGVFNDAPHMWMCTRLDGVSDDGGATFNVTYEFQRNPDSWDPWVIYTDPATGKPIVLSQDDIHTGEALKQVVIYRQRDFWGLNLVLPAGPRPR